MDPTPSKVGDHRALYEPVVRGCCEYVRACVCSKIELDSETEIISISYNSHRYKACQDYNVTIKEYFIDYCVFSFKGIMQPLKQAKSKSCFCLLYRPKDDFIVSILF